MSRLDLALVDDREVRSEKGDVRVPASVEINKVLDKELERELWISGRWSPLYT